MKIIEVFAHGRHKTLPSTCHFIYKPCNLWKILHFLDQFLQLTVVHQISQCSDEPY